MTRWSMAVQGTSNGGRGGKPLARRSRMMTRADSVAYVYPRAARALSTVVLPAPGLPVMTKRRLDFFSTQVSSPNSRQVRGDDRFIDLRHSPVKARRKRDSRSCARAPSLILLSMSTFLRWAACRGGRLVVHRTNRKNAPLDFPHESGTLSPSVRGDKEHDRPSRR